MQTRRKALVVFSSLNAEIKKEDAIFDSRNIASIERGTYVTLVRKKCMKVIVSCDCLEKMAFELRYERSAGLGKTEGKGRGESTLRVPWPDKGMVWGGVGGM